MATEVERAYIFRPYVQDDLNFIQSSWASSYYKGANYIDYVSPEEFNFYHRPIRDRILKRPMMAAIICAAKENHSTILGWIIVESPAHSPGIILHYLYVKEAFKGEKIAKELLKVATPLTPVMYTHQTEKAQRIIRRTPQNYPHLHFTPHLL